MKFREIWKSEEYEYKLHRETESQDLQAGIILADSWLQKDGGVLQCDSLP